MSKNEIIEELVKKIITESSYENVIGDRFIHMTEQHLIDMAEEMKNGEE